MSACHHPLALGAAGAGALFSLGLAGSLHCLGMCGPLSAALTGAPSAGRLALYHGGRLSAYAALGWLAARLGTPLQPLIHGPWLVLAAALPLLAYALWPRDWALPGLARALRSGLGAARTLPPAPRALSLGLLTPLLPCGLLYAALAAALAAPAPLHGALWLLAFAAGTLPLLLLGAWGQARAFAAGGPWPLRLRRACAATAGLSLILFTLLP
jgi:sulfite exporter TauE/SafE